MKMIELKGKLFDRQHKFLDVEFKYKYHFIFSMSGVTAVVVGGIITYLTHVDHHYFRGKSLIDEINWVKKRSRSGDHYPQGANWVINQMQDAMRTGKQIHLMAKHTFPKWTWYIEVQP